MHLFICAGTPCPHTYLYNVYISIHISIYIYICVDVHIYIYIFGMCVSLSVHICIPTHTYTHTHTHARTALNKPEFGLFLNPLRLERPHRRCHPRGDLRAAKFLRPLLRLLKATAEACSQIRLKSADIRRRVADTA